MGSAVAGLLFTPSLRMVRSSCGWVGERGIPGVEGSSGVEVGRSWAGKAGQGASAAVPLPPPEPERSPPAAGPAGDQPAE